MKSSKGLSTVLETVIMVAIVIAVISIVWISVNTLVKSQTSIASSCFNIGDKVAIDPQFTCYNETTNKLRIAINVGDINNLQDILISVTQGGTTSSFKINADSSTSGIIYLDGTGPVQIPGQKMGFTYLVPLAPVVKKFPDKVEIAPIINGNTCTGPRALTQIDSCFLLAQQ